MRQQQGRVLPLHIDSPDSLQAMWMPFILSGGLFIPGAEAGELREKIFLLLLLPGMEERIAVGGEVVWINPAGTVSGAPLPGIGVRLLENDGAARKAIEHCLTGALPGQRPLYCRENP